MKIATSPVGQPINKLHGGFTYIMVMVAAMVVSIMAGVGLTVVSREVQADREMELLFRGMAYREAIGRYYQVGKSYPPNLEALLLDSRFPSTRRYLRTLYQDPMAGEKEEWQQIKGNGGIMGVFSSSKAVPLKQANFPKGYEKFAEAKTYSEWVFSYDPQVAPNKK